MLMGPGRCEIFPLGAQDGGEQFARELWQACAPHARRAGVHIVLSEDWCRVAPVTWNPQIVSAEERQHYARALFQQAGRAVDSGWLVDTRFWHLGELGLAYAISAILVDALFAGAAAHQITPLSVRPLSVCLVEQARRAMRHSRGIIALEADRLTLLGATTGRLACFDAEPVYGSPDEALVRLLAREARPPGSTGWAVWPRTAMSPEIAQLLQRAGEGTVQELDWGAIHGR
jgi:hypothetical protein